MCDSGCSHAIPATNPDDENAAIEVSLQACRVPLSRVVVREPLMLAGAAVLELCVTSPSRLASLVLHPCHSVRARLGDTVATFLCSSSVSFTYARRIAMARCDFHVLFVLVALLAATQMEPGSPVNGVLVEVIAQIIREPFFDQLRTKQQLGYLVFSGTRTDDSITFMRFILQVRVNTLKL